MSAFLCAYLQLLQLFTTFTQLKVFITFTQLLIRPFEVNWHHNTLRHCMGVTQRHLPEGHGGGGASPTHKKSHTTQWTYKNLLTANSYFSITLKKRKKQGSANMLTIATTQRSVPFKARWHENHILLLLRLCNRVKLSLLIYQMNTTFLTTNLVQWIIKTICINSFSQMVWGTSSHGC